MELMLNLPAYKWNQFAPATLEFGFPDAASPQSMVVSIGPRMLAVRFREIVFAQRQ